MKRVKYLVYALIIFMVGISVSYAASLGVSTNRKNVTVGSTFTVTVNASGAAGWEYCVAYDSSLFTLTSATSDTGGACVRTGSTLIGYSKVTFTFKANKSGTGTISLRDAVMYGDDGNALSSTKGSVSIIAKTQQEIEASYSTNADLKSLTVGEYEINPAFNKDTLEYSLEVENDIEVVNVVATKADGNASVTGAGEIALSEGINKVEIVVTAQKGNKKTYVLNITRKELNPITVKVDGESLNVVRKAESLEAPMYYSSTTITIDDTEVPAFESEITGYTLVGLKDEDGNIKLYRYENGDYILYNQIAKDSFVFIPLTHEELIEGYKNKKTIKINDISIEVYSNKEEDTEIVLVYGMNASAGDKNWYKYDTKEGTFQRYVESEEVGKVSDEYFYLTIVFASGLGLSILIIIVLLIMNSKNIKKNVKLIEFIEYRMNTSKSSNKNTSNSVDEIDDLTKQFLNFVDMDEQEEERKNAELASNDENIEQEKVEESLSKRELRKLEKEKLKQEEEELKAMQADFLETRENTIISDTDILEEVQENMEKEESSEVPVKEKKSTKTKKSTSKKSTSKSTKKTKKK